MQQPNEDGRDSRFWNLINVNSQTNIQNSEYHRRLTEAYLAADDEQKAVLDAAIAAVANALSGKDLEFRAVEQSNGFIDRGGWVYWQPSGGEIGLSGCQHSCISPL